MCDELRTRVLRYLQSHHVLTLATVGEDGPAAAALFYACDDDFTLYFLSDPKTEHCRNLRQRPAVAVTVQDNVEDWQRIQGIQLWGTAAQLEDSDEAERAWAVYTARFPFVARLRTGTESEASDPALATQFQKVRLYKVVPRRIRLIDNTRGFAHKEELVLIV